MTYTVTIERKAQKVLAKIQPHRIRERIEGRIAGLASDPRPEDAIKLVAVDAYRVRVADYRIVYTVDDGVRVVNVTNVGHRREIYREV